MTEAKFRKQDTTFIPGVPSDSPAFPPAEIPQPVALPVAQGAVVGPQGGTAVPSQIVPELELRPFMREAHENVAPKKVVQPAVSAGVSTESAKETPLRETATETPAKSAAEPAKTSDQTTVLP
jgi:hypothetical protein